MSTLPVQHSGRGTRDNLEARQEEAQSYSCEDQSSVRQGSPDLSSLPNPDHSATRRPSPMQFRSPREHVADPERTPRLHDLPKIISTMPTPCRLPTSQRIDSRKDYFLLSPATEKPTFTPSESEQTSSEDSSAHPSSATSSEPSSKDKPTTSTPHSPVGSVHTSPTVATVEAAPVQSIPSYPDQSHDALQQYSRGLFTPRSAPIPSRSLTLHPVSRPQNKPLIRPAARPSGSRTVGNSPAVSPGLNENSGSYTPTTPDTAGPFSYLNNLHPTRRPKETYIADIDVDPISGHKLINNYEIIGELGRGVHGKVKLGRSHETGQFVAIKIVERYPKKRRLGKLDIEQDKVKREIAILKKARHPNIVALLEVIDDPARKKVYIVLERVDLGEINWRADSPFAREIPLIEYFRYERESRGVFDNEAAEQEDRAMLELARVRRAKAARARYRTLRRQDTNDETGAWSIETAGGINDESDLDDASRGSTSTGSQHGGEPLAGTISSRSSSLSHTTSFRSLSPVATRSTSITVDTSVGSTYKNVVDMHRVPRSLDPLEGTMYGRYAEPFEQPEPADVLDNNSRAANLAQTHYTQDSGANDNLMQKAIELSETDILPDLRYVPTMSFDAIRLAFRDTLLGIQYLHYHGVIHRDIKPPNLLQTREHRIKISDFGVSYLGRSQNEDTSDNMSESETHDFDEAKELAKTVGTAAFFAPELCYTDNDDEQPPVGKAIDVWALGITLFCMIFARVPIAESSEYVAMRRIADETIYIPSKRLMPIGPQTSTYDRMNPPIAGTRSPTALSYEELDEALLDLLRRLLHKNPQDRITLEEVRHHPWVVADIAEKEKWLDESDPAMQALGKKIEVTKEDLEQSLQPLTLVSRIRSGIKKAVAAGFGLGRSSSVRKKEIPTPLSGTPTTPATSSSGSFDFRKTSIRGDENIISALKASRDGEHPLSQSVAASPDEPRGKSFLTHTTAIVSPQPEGAQTPLYQTLHAHASERTASLARTVKLADESLDTGHGPSRSRSSSPAPSLDSPGGSNLSGILGGASRLLKSVRGRSRTGPGAEQRDRTSRSNSSDTGDARANASLAISTASAAGEIDVPEVLKDTTTPSTSASQSLSSSPALGSVFSFGNRPSDDKFRFSRQSSTSSVGHLDRMGGAGHHHSRSSSLLRNMSTEEDMATSENDVLRRRLAELQAGLPSSDTSRRSSAAVVPLPASSYGSISAAAQEESFAQRRRNVITAQSSSSMAPSVAPSLETSPASALSSNLPLITPSGSVDAFAFGSSAKATATFPNVLSHDIPETLALPHGTMQGDSSPLPKTPQTARRWESPPDMDDDEGYKPDPEIDVDHPTNSSSSDDDDEDEEEDGLEMMGRRKHQARANGRGGLKLAANAQVARQRERRDTAGSAFSKKSSRSGSNNTTRRVVSNPADSGPYEIRASSARVEENRTQSNDPGTNVRSTQPKDVVDR